MHYVSAYNRSPSFNNFFRWLQLIMLVLPTAILLIALMFEQRPSERSELKETIPWITVAMVAVIVVMRAVQQRQAQLSVEIDETGIRHLGPGALRTLSWAEVKDARVVQINKNEQAVRVRTPSMRYLLRTHLVADTPDAPQLQFGFIKAKWVYPDGRTEPADIQHSVGWKAVAQYRPDLLKNGKIPRGW